MGGERLWGFRCAVALDAFGAADQVFGLASVATQILVIFIIRTAHSLQDQPPPLRLVGSPAAFGLPVALS